MDLWIAEHTVSPCVANKALAVFPQAFNSVAAIHNI
jgi:hypothetical protein